MHLGGSRAYTSALYVLPWFWCVTHGSPVPLPESAELEDACGEHYGAIYDAANSWTTAKECASEACFVPEHESQYKGLKERCKLGHRQRDDQAKAIRAKLPDYTGSVVRSMSQLSSVLKSEIYTLQQIVQQQYGALERAWQHGVQLQRELLLTNVESGRIARALLYHAVLLESPPDQLVASSYAYHGANGRMVARLLEFVRSLPVAEERLAAYRKLEELLPTHAQDERFPAVIFSQDVRQLNDTGAQDAPNHGRFEAKTVARWQRLLLGGNFTELILFAADYPTYYAHLESALLAVLKDNWSAQALATLIDFPNTLPTPEQRVSALGRVLEALLEHQDEQHNDAYLMRLANELTKLETDLDGATAEVRKRLDEVKQLFAQFSYQRDLATYVELYGFFRAAI